MPLLSPFLISIRFSRQGSLHRTAMAHLGDYDFQVDVQHLPAARDDAPDCPYGLQCYRLNPLHFREHKHPPESKTAWLAADIIVS